MKRTQFMLGRVMQGLLAILLIATVNFMLVRAAPGDPVSVLAGEAGASDPQFVARSCARSSGSTSRCRRSSPPMSARWCSSTSATRTASSSRC